MFYSDNESANAVLAVLAMLIGAGVFMFLMAAGYIVTSIIMGFMFKKAGEPMWKAWVPVYNMWVLYELAGYKGWVYLLVVLSVSLLGWIPVIGFIVALAAIAITVMVALNLQRAYGKETVWIILYIFLPLVWMAVIAFDKSSYDKDNMLPAIPEALSK